jgi:hypothetical protein
MARTYASLLGLLAFALLLARAVGHGWGAGESMIGATIAAAIFAAIGFAAGGIAELFVNDSVRGQFQAAMAEFEAEQKN